MDNLKDLEAMSVVVKEFRTVSQANRAILLNMLTKEHEVLADKVDDPFYEIKKTWIRNGRTGGDKIATIKAIRNLAGYDIDEKCLIGLKEAKDLVESW